MTTGNLKSCFGVGNVNFRCMKVWRSYHVVKLLWRNYNETKLLATENLASRLHLLYFSVGKCNLNQDLNLGLQ